MLELDEEDAAAAQKDQETKTQQKEALGNALTDMSDALAAAQQKVEEAGAVQKNVEEAYNKVVEAVESLKKLTAQAEVDKAQYDELVEQYEKSLEEYKEALETVDALDKELEEIAEIVDRAIADAESKFEVNLDVPGGNGVVQEDTEENQTDDAEADVVADVADQIGEEGNGGEAELEEIADEELPLGATIENEKFNMNFLNWLWGILAAMFAFFLLLFKRKKEEEEEEAEAATEA